MAAPTVGNSSPPTAANPVAAWKRSVAGSAGKLEDVVVLTRGVVGVLDGHVDVPVGRRGRPVQVAVDVDAPGRYLQQRNVGQHQRRIGGARRRPAGLVEASSTQRRDVAVYTLGYDTKELLLEATDLILYAARGAAGYLNSAHPIAVPLPRRKSRWSGLLRHGKVPYSCRNAATGFPDSNRRPGK